MGERGRCENTQFSEATVRKTLSVQRNTVGVYKHRFSVVIKKLNQTARGSRWQSPPASTRAHRRHRLVRGRGVRSHRL